MAQKLQPLKVCNKLRTLKIETPKTLAPIHVLNKLGPKFPASASFVPPTENGEEYA